MEYDIYVDEFEDKYYYKKGTYILHREGGPAIECKNLDNEWWANGVRHRTDGPAIEYSDGHKAWWINGERLSQEKEDILNQWWDNKNGI